MLDLGARSMTMTRSSLKNILYVDDEENNLKSFKATFRRYYNIFTAQSGKEALDILRNNPIKVVITDQRMPEMTGVQFLEAIIPEFPNTVRMILTGYSDVEAIIKAINTGRVYRYVTKPWEPDELKLIIDGAFKIYELEEHNRQLILDLQNEVIKGQGLLNIFKKYVPENVIKEIMLTDDKASIIGGETRIISLIFSDIRHFTILAAKIDPRECVKFLNKYFQIMGECVKRHHGSINKFIGDGILSVFGAPDSYIDNQNNAVNCAVDMIKALSQLNEEYEQIFGEPITIGIGINTGEVIVGNVGSDDRVEYTVIGDTVNIGSKIENLTRQHSNMILVSQSTYDAVKNNQNLTFVDYGEHDLHGKINNLRLYHLVMDKNK